MGQSRWAAGVVVSYRSWESGLRFSRSWALGCWGVWGVGLRIRDGRIVVSPAVGAGGLRTIQLEFVRCKEKKMKEIGKESKKADGNKRGYLGKERKKADENKRGFL
ncbi:hypothetical protein Tco_0164200 [Tanacetum coccineum]